MTLTHRLKARIRELPVVGPAAVWLRGVTLNGTARRAYAQNIKYDRDTVAVMARVLRRDSHTIDVGAHRGDILCQLVRLAPEGTHTACEPIPHLAAQLRQEFPAVELHQVAVSHLPGTASFSHIRNRPAHSGLRPRTYDLADAQVDTLTVAVKRLDDIIPSDRQIDFIKVDVEGGDLNVLRGGVETIRRSRPYIVFEAGRKAAGLYGITGDDIFDFLTMLGYSLTTMEQWLQGGEPYDKPAFLGVWESGAEYYFMACPGAERAH
jgi:FkbM family methyltransferase